MEAKKKAPGRPRGTRKVSAPGEPYGAPELRVRLHPDLMAWVRDQGGPAWVRDLLAQMQADAR